MCKHKNTDIKTSEDKSGDKIYTSVKIYCKDCNLVLSDKRSVSYLPSNKTDK